MSVQFKSYKAKPITKMAYQIKDGDKIVQSQGGDPAKVVTADGRVQRFKANMTVVIGDFIVDNGPGNIEHAREDVFKLRNIV